MAVPLPTNATTEITGIYSLFQYIQHDATGGMFFPMILFAVFIIMFIALKSYPTSRAAAGSSYLTMIMAIILRTLDLIQNSWMYVTIIITAIATIWMYYENG
ncbi:MAG: hypothetical protein ACOCUD_01670 [Bacillota bacterium]